MGIKWVSHRMRQTSINYKSEKMRTQYDSPQKKSYRKQIIKCPRHKNCREMRKYKQNIEFACLSETIIQ